jgi:uncharacterized membrane protein YuzA (DUF378 family)
MMRQPSPRRVIRAWDVLALTLATIGAINWGLSGAANLNLVRRLFGRGSILERAVYIVVGLAGLNLAWFTARYIMGQEQPPLGPVTGRAVEEAERMQRQYAGEGIQQRAQRAGEEIRRGVEEAGQEIRRGGY